MPRTGNTGGGIKLTQKMMSSVVGYAESQVAVE